MDIPQVTPLNDSETGEMGQSYLATGKQVALRRWEEPQCGFGVESVRSYEIVGYVISGTLELDLHGQVATLRAGDSWLIPSGVPHRYRILEAIVAIEATSPPARFNERDEPAST